MSKPLTRTQINEKKFRRINDKSLRQLLIHRFLNDYGYDKGEVTATAIVDDILKTVEDYFVITLPLEKLTTGDALPEDRLLSYGHLVWMAVPIDEYPERGKSIIKTRMKPVILTYLATEDIESFRNGFTSRQLRINRLVRWCHQAYDQGALLTQLDLAVLLNVCDQVVCDYVNEWQKTTGEILPTRGNIHDLSGAITHKKEIITLYLQGHLTPVLPPRPSIQRRQLIDTSEIMSPSKSFVLLPLILIKSRRSHDFLSALSLNISTSSRSTNFKLWMQTLPIPFQISKEKPNDTRICCSKRT